MDTGKVRKPSEQLQTTKPMTKHQTSSNQSSRVSQKVKSQKSSCRCQRVVVKEPAAAMGTISGIDGIDRDIWGPI